MPYLVPHEINYFERIYIMARKSEKQVVLETVDAPLRELGFTDVNIMEGWYRYINPDNKMSIAFNRSPYGDYFRVSHFAGNQHVNLDFFNKGLTSDVYFKSKSQNERRDELREILLGFLDATVTYALPLMERLSMGKLQFTEHQYLMLSKDTQDKAKMFSQKYDIPIEYSEANVEKLSSILDTLRCNDYSDENLMKNLDAIIEAAAYFGEILIDRDKTAHWKFDERDEVYVVKFRNSDCSPLGCITDHWDCTPELEIYTLQNRCKVIFGQFRINYGRFE